MYMFSLSIALLRPHYQVIDRAGIGLEFMFGWILLFKIEQWQGGIIWCLLYEQGYLPHHLKLSLYSLLAWDENIYLYYQNMRRELRRIHVFLF